MRSESRATGIAGRGAYQVASVRPDLPDHATRRHPRLLVLPVLRPLILIGLVAMAFTACSEPRQHSAALQPPGRGAPAPAASLSPSPASVRVEQPPLPASAATATPGPPSLAPFQVGMIEVTVDKGAGARYLIGDAITLCSTARLDAVPEGYRWQATLYEAGSGRQILHMPEAQARACATLTATPPARAATLRADLVACRTGACALQAVAETKIEIAPRPAPEHEVTGLFRDVRNRRPGRTVMVGPRPPSLFPDWNGASTVVYDTRNRTFTNLGPGGLGRFSADSRRMVWSDGRGAQWVNGEPAIWGGNAGWIPLPPDELSRKQVWLLDLPTMERRSLGPGIDADFVDGEEIRIAVVGPDGPRWELHNVRTGRRRPTERPRAAAAPPDMVEVRGLNERLHLARVLTDDEPTEWGPNAFEMTDLSSGRTLLRFRAAQVLAAAGGDLLVMLGPRDGRANMFVVEGATGQATFIATLDTDASGQPPPAALNEHHVFWTDAMCRPEQRSFVHDRRNGSLTRLVGDVSGWPSFTRDGQVLLESVGGAAALFDPAAAAYTIVIPSALFTRWSPDHRYAIHGAEGHAFHGNWCH